MRSPSASRRRDSAVAFADIAFGNPGVHPHHARHGRARDCANPGALADARLRPRPSRDAGSTTRTIDLARVGHCRQWITNTATPVLRDANDTTVVSLRSTMSGNSFVGRPVSLDARRVSALACGVALTRSRRRLRRRNRSRPDASRVPDTRLVIPDLARSHGNGRSRGES